MTSSGRKYDVLIGTGGVGGGTFFALNGDHTLGREESRSGRFLDRRDYCKLHIIAHYAQVLLDGGFTAFPVGAVGQDELGGRLLEEMRRAGMDTRYMSVLPGLPTLYSVCLLYPDGSGGNLTVDNSACAHVGPADIAAAEDEFARHAGRGIALAAPEVPLAARVALLEMAGRHGFFRVASFASGEMAEVRRQGLLAHADLLAVNLHEAAALAELPDDLPAERIAERTIAFARAAAPHIALSITAGRQASWCYDGAGLHHLPAYSVPVASSAGAGDAHLGGMLAGLAEGMSLADAQRLGTLTAALSVTSPHTIHPEIDRPRLAAFARELHAELPAPVGRFLENLP